MLLLFWKIGGTPPEPEPEVPEQVTGGWAAENVARLDRAARERRAKARRREQEEEAALRKEADRLESHLINEGVLEPIDDMARIRALMAQHEAEALSNRTRRAFEYAERARSQAAYELAEREIARMREEELIAVLMLVALD